MSRAHNKQFCSQMTQFKNIYFKENKWPLYKHKRLQIQTTLIIDYFYSNISLIKIRVCYY